MTRDEQIHELIKMIKIIAIGDSEESEIQAAERLLSIAAEVAGDACAIET